MNSKIKPLKKIVDKELFLLDKLVLMGDPFYTTKAPGKGLGIGLYIVQEIIREYSGEIGVISHPEKGTEFIIRLPYPIIHCVHNETINEKSEPLEA